MLEKIHLFLFILFFSLQGFSVSYQELPPELDGSMNLYDFNAEEELQIPDSLTPVRISYIARHGARYLTSEKKVLSVERALEKARRTGSITRLGRDCMALMQDVRVATDGRWGLLSDIGKMEEMRLGSGMAKLFPEVFGSSEARLEGVSSYVTRVIETMDHFFIPIADAYTGLYVKSESGRRYDHLTRFFANDPKYDAWRDSPVWKEAYERFARETLPVEPALRLVGKNSGMSADELRQLSYDLYKVLQGLRSMGMTPPSTQWMSEDEYRRCWEATNLEKYFQYSVSSISCEPAKGAAQVLFRLIDEQNAIIDGGYSSPGLYGIFGHAETLLPVFALLGVPGTTALPLDYTSLAKEWNDALLTPLAANLAIIYSRSPSGHLYASMRLNGKNVSPVNDKERMTVEISELRDYWINRFAQLVR